MSSLSQCSVGLECCAATPQHPGSPLSCSLQWLFPPFSLLRHLLLSSLSFSPSIDGIIAYSSEGGSFRWDHFFLVCCLQPNPSHHHLLSVLMVSPPSRLAALLPFCSLSIKNNCFASIRKFLLASSFLFSFFIIYKKEDFLYFLPIFSF